MANTLDTQQQQYTIVKTQYGKHQQDCYHDEKGIMSSIVPGTHASGPHLTKTKIGTRIRRLTPVECARLQGFPDDWHEGVSDSQAYRCYGNAVTVDIVELIARRLKQ